MAMSPVRQSNGKSPVHWLMVTHPERSEDQTRKGETRIIRDTEFNSIRYYKIWFV